jgi:hypothetical protein
MTEKTKFNPLFPYLQNNEAFVWVGRPDNERWLRRQTKPKDEHFWKRLQFYLYLFATAFFLWVFIYAHTTENLLFFTLGIGIILLLIVLHYRIVRFNIHQDKHHKYGMVFAISNLHLFTWHNKFLRSIPIDWVEYAIIEVHGEYETIRWFITPPYEDTYIHFDYVKNAQDIVNIVADVLARPIPIVKAENDKRTWLS